jgi:flagellar protein FlaG
MINEIAGPKELRAVGGDRDAMRSVSVPPTASTSVASREPQEPDAASDEQALQRAVARVREVFQGASARLQIEIDRDLDRVVIKIVNGQSGEVIRQIPPEELLELARRFDGAKGLLLKERV